MANVSHKPWDGSESRWPTAEAFAKSCLINLNTGPSSGWTKDKCYLPVREPDGTINANAVSSAVTYLARTNVPASAKKAAAAKLRSIYSNELGVKPADQPKTLSRY